jgi:hypothetical protein
MAGGRRDVFGKTSAEIDAEQLQGATGVDATAEARRAGVARDDGIDGDGVAAFEAADVAAHLFDHAAELVPLHGGVFDALGELAAVNMQISAAQPRVPGLDQDLAGPEHWIGDVTDANVALTVENACFHLATVLLLAPEICGTEATRSGWFRIDNPRWPPRPRVLAFGHDVQ